MILISCSIDSQSQYVNIGDDDNDLEILEFVAPNDSVNCDSKNSKKMLKQPLLKYGIIFQNVVRKWSNVMGVGKNMLGVALIMGLPP